MKRQSRITVLLRMLKLVKPLSGFMIMAVCFGTLGFLCAQFIPVLGGYAVLCGTDAKPPVSFKTIAILLPVLALLRAVLRLAEQRTNHYIAFTLLAIIRDRVFKALRRLCPAKLEGRDKGDLIALITSDVELLEVFYAHTISPICIAFITEAVMCLFIGSYHWSLGVLALAAYVSIGVILPGVISKRSGSLGDELRAENGKLAAHMLESIRGIDTTQQYHNGEQRLQEIGEKTDAIAGKQERLSNLTGRNLASANTLILLFDTAMLVLETYLYTKGIIGFDGFLIPLIALMSSYGPVSALSALGTTLQNTVASGSRVLAIIDEQPETEDITGMPASSFGDMEAEHVSFAYGSEEILHDLSLQIPQNGITGIAGKSGCGKSTLLKLLMRFWSADEGNIAINGRSIEEINTSDLRSMESYMTQTTDLFKDTIANNVLIGRLDATREEVEEACRKASIHDFIMTLPSGYDTQIGELGDTLSGGEKQRIGLARAFLHDAPLLLLDEPTSNLDSLNEAIVLKALQETADNKTLLLVSHRKSTLCIADRVYRMEQGRITAQES